MKAPAADRRSGVVEVHGDRRTDEFSYMRRADDPSTIRAIREENAYFQACMSPVCSFAERLYEELRGRVLEDDVSVAEIIDGFSYYTRIAAGRQYPVHCRMAVDGAEEVYLDENRLAADGPYCDVAIVSICPKRRRVACAVDRTGEETYEILVATIPDGDFVSCARDTGDSIGWSRDGRCLIYTETDDNARPESVWACDLETMSRTRMYMESDPAFHVSTWNSRDDAWILIDSASNTTSETWCIPADTPLTAPLVLFPRREGVEYTVEPHENRFLVVTNDVSDNFRLVSVPTPPESPEIEELVPARQDVSLEYVDAYRNHVVIGERWNGRDRVMVWDLENDTRRALPGSGDELVCLDVDDLYDCDARYVRFEQSTPVSPHAVYDYEVATAASTLRKAADVPGYDEDQYVCERHSVDSNGVRVPLTLVYRREPPPEPAGAPVLLTGYGAYETPVDTEFDSDLVSLLDRGVIAAMAHVRGGGDLGPGWHDAGRLAEKENSFADFIACAEYLIERRYTTAGRIAARGASAGGLLVAVAINRRPGLFGAAVLEVPFLDVLNTLLDRELPLTEYDFEEFGDPSVEEEYHWIRPYSPYDNIRPAAYPPMLVTTAMNDQRVGYWEALKWVARLRAEKTDEHPVLLKIDDTGHLGRSGRYEAMREAAEVYAFLLDTWGLSGEPS